MEMWKVRLAYSAEGEWSGRRRGDEVFLVWRRGKRRGRREEWVGLEADVGRWNMIDVKVLNCG